jgi:enolase-phosphatase E1
MKAILLDIEGTTTPIDFVHEILFPFAAEKVEAFVSENFASLTAEIIELEKEYHTDFKNQIYGRDFKANSAESVANYLKFLIEVDRKSTPLKTIQGKIWQKGYEAGELKSEIFADVPKAFERWKSQGKTIAIYSSGSVLAQKLLFGFTNVGDLNPFISRYFDTAVGGKRETESYQKIAEELGFPPVEILFLSDVLEELDAAAEAGFQTIVTIREGNGILRQPINHDALASFTNL